MRHFSASLIVAATLAAQPAESPRQVVEITAERFTFTPSEVKTKAGTTLEIRLRSDDTAHGFTSSAPTWTWSCPSEAREWLP